MQIQTAKSNTPTVSVVMVIRDVEQFLSEAIDSILIQSFQDFEFIIVDFGSTDGSKRIAGKYAAQDERIRLIEIPACTYIQAKIAACTFPRGRYIAIQDADDVSLPDRLQDEVDYLERHRRVALLGGSVQRIDGEGKMLGAPSFPETKDQELRRELMERNPFWHPTVLLRTDAYREIGGYRAVFAQSDDYDLWLRIVERYGCANLDRVVLRYRIHPNQLSLQKKKDQVLCALAARAAAALRAAGKADPLDAAQVITPDLLAEMGVGRDRQQIAVAEAFSYWIQQLYMAGEYPAVEQACKEMIIECRKKYVGSRLIADTLMMSAKASWKLGNVARTGITVSRAIWTSPRILARPLKPLLQAR